MPNYSQSKVYILKNVKNDKVYIGQTTETLEKRLQRHFNHTNDNISYSMTDPIQEIGKEHFYIELLEEYPCNSKKEIENIECFWMNFFIEVLGKENVYNKMIDSQHDEKTKKKMSEDRKSEKNGFYGKKHTNETKSKLSQHFTGHKLSQETKQKISQANKGENHPQFKRGGIYLIDGSWYFKYSQNGTQKSKSYSIKKYGNDEAYRLIIEFQNQIYPQNDS